jgi:hypothetical protein
MPEPSGTRHRAWRPAGGAPDSGRGARRGRALALAAAVLALTGALAAWLLYHQPFPRPHFLPLCLDEYGDGFPVRRWVRQDGDALRGLRWRESNAFTSQQREQLRSELRNLAGLKPADPVVVYLSAYVLPRADGVCVLPVDARPDNPAGWVRLRDAFDHLLACPSRDKLLLLDVMHPFTDPRHGVLADDAAAQVEPELQAALGRDGALRVLCACSPGQVSLGSEELGHTAFGYFLYRGLRGEADGSGGKAADGRVSVRELADYVTSGVERWAWRNRKARQTPRLLGPKGDFALVEVAPGPVAESPLDGAYPEWLLAGWKLRDGWFRDGSYRHAPEAFRELDAALLRAEQQWRGGFDPDRVRADLRTRQQLLQRRRDEHVPERGEPGSLAEALAVEPRPKLGDAAAELQRLLALLPKARRPKADEADVKRLTGETEQFLKKLEGKPLALAVVVCEGAAESALGREGLTFLVELLEKGKGPPYREVRSLRELARQAADRPGVWVAEAVRLGVQAAQEAEKAAAAEPQARPWVENKLKQASARFREGRALLFAEDRASQGRCLALLKEAVREYQVANQDLQTVQEALRLRDEALVLLPGYAPLLELGEGPDQAWQSAVRAACALRDGLAASPAREVSELAGLTEALRNDPNGWQSLRRPLDPERFPKSLRRSRNPDPADVRSMAALLAGSWPTAGQRPELWKAWRAAAADLERRSSAAGGEPPAFDAGAAVRAERERAVRRARRSLALLRLRGVADLDKAQAALAASTRNPTDAATLDRLGGELRQAWARVRPGGE